MFAKQVLAVERELHSLDHEVRVSLRRYLRHSRPAAVLSVPIIYFGIVPFAFLDLFLAVYQGICFPLYGIPKVQRSRYLVFDRAKLRYLNGVERVNCHYCSYANGLAAYFVEIAARTEQHWCPIKHKETEAPPHSRYGRFFDYGDDGEFFSGFDEVRGDFRDLDDR
jgi:hypothetical protein